MSVKNMSGRNMRLAGFIVVSLFGFRDAQPVRRAIDCECDLPERGKVSRGVMLESHMPDSLTYPLWRFSYFLFCPDSPCRFVPYSASGVCPTFVSLLHLSPTSLTLSGSSG